MSASPWQQWYQVWTDQAAGTHGGSSRGSATRLLPALGVRPGKDGEKDVHIRDQREAVTGAQTLREPSLDRRWQGPESPTRPKRKENCPAE